MKEISDKNFGVLIAFALPGFILLWGLSFSGGLELLPDSLLKADESSVGGFFTTALASLSAGMLLSALRWVIFDRFLLHGLASRQTEINSGKLATDEKRYAVFQGIVENHYRYYQYYSSTFVAIAGAFLVYLCLRKEIPGVWNSVFVIFLCGVLFFAARDSLKRYVDRASEITK